MKKTVWLTTGEKILRLLFPARCLFCHQITKEADNICEECRERENSEPYTRIYAVGYIAGAKGKEMSCFAPVRYAGGIRETIHRFKFQGKTVYARPLAQLMADRTGLDGQEFDILAFVPMSRKKMRNRGYNQSELLARELGSLLDVPVRELLEKRRDNAVQHELDYAKRQENVKDVYRAKTEAGGKRILLVDDIITTGATLCACADMLYHMGAQKVTAVCIADAVLETGGAENG